jgi:calcium-activated chloride channel regulator 4
LTTFPLQSRAAENEIEVLATKTNGKSFFIDDEGITDPLNDAFMGSLTYLPAVPLEDLTVLLHQHKYQHGLTFHDSTMVDFTVGRNLTFRIDYTKKSHLLSFSVVSPISGTVYNNLTHDDAAKLAYIIIPGTAEIGQWNFTLTVSSSPTDYVSVIVTSKSKTSSGPITVECNFDEGTVKHPTIKPIRLFAYVKQGQNRVIGAHVQ